MLLGPPPSSPAGAAEGGRRPLNPFAVVRLESQGDAGTAAYGTDTVVGSKDPRWDQAMPRMIETSVESDRLVVEVRHDARAEVQAGGSGGEASGEGGGEHTPRYIVGPDGTGTRVGAGGGRGVPNYNSIVSLG